MSNSPIDAAAYSHRELNPGNLPSPVQLTKFSRRNLAKWFRVLGYAKGAEIGVAEGKHAKQMLELNPGMHLLCVDTWEKYPGNPRSHPQSEHDRNIKIAQRVLEPFDAEIIKAYSMGAVRDVPLESLDFVYIDGNHGFDYVMEDLIAWGRRVRKGGIISGHDYYHFRGAGVVEAVDAYVAAHGIKEWWLTNEKKEKSWFWVKR
jgi:hypothetical protein